MPTTRELDVRPISPPERDPEIFGAFDALKADEAFVLVTDHDPRPLLSRFQAERPASFEWNLLEAGPARFRIEIRRRATEGASTVSDHLERDHKRLDAIVARVQELLAAGSFPDASERFAEFTCGLGRHIDAEEQVLFPAFEELTGMTSGGPTFVMRGEHVEIRRLMDAATGALRGADAAEAEETLHGLVAILGTHNMKEERMLYPMADRAAGSDSARSDLVKRIQAF